MLRPLRAVMSLRISLVTAFSSLILATALTIVGYTDSAQREATLDLSDQLIDQVSETVILQTTRYLVPAMTTARLVADHEEERLGQDADHDELMQFMSSMLRVHPQLASVYVGDVQGNLFQVRRERAMVGPDGGEQEVFVHRTIERVEGQAVRDRRVQVSLDGTQSYGETDKASDYDPRVRPWYEMVAEKGHGMWTDTYVFYTAGEPGLTAAQPIFGPEGSLVAVSATDITMGALSGFLEEQKIGKTGTALILNPRDEVVAHPDPAVFVGMDGEIELPSLDGLGVSWWSDALSHHKRTGDLNLRYESEGLRYMAHFIEFPESFRKRWRLAVVVPVDDFMDRSRQIRTNSLLISALTLLVAILLSSVLSRRVSRPIMGLAEKVQHIREFRLDNDFGAQSRIREVQVMSDALGTMQAGLRSFSRFVPADLVRQLVEAGEEAQLGGQERNITVLFSDLRGYSTIIEYMPPQDVLGMLNEYLGGMQEVIEQHQGTVLEYIGDAILVVFGAPSNLDRHPEMAVRCALAMQQRLVELNDQWIGTGIAQTWQDHGVERLTARIGVHTGVAIAGNVGTRTHMKYGVVGDAVNVAARLEQLNKKLRTEVLVSEETWAHLPGSLTEDSVDQGVFELKGRGQGQRAYSFDLEQSGTSADA